MRRAVSSECSSRGPPPFASTAVGHDTEALAHAELEDHLAGEAVDALQVLGGAGGDLAEDELLGGVTAEQGGHLSSSDERVSSSRSPSSRVITAPSVRPRGMTLTRCGMRAPGSAWPTTAWPLSW